MHSMKKIHFAMIASLVAGLAAGAMTLRVIEPEPIASTKPDSNTHFDQTAATEERIRALEDAVFEERNARQLLEEQLHILFAELDTLRNDAEEQGEDREIAIIENRDSPRSEFFRSRERTVDSNTERTAVLVEAGFPPDRADWIVARENEIRLETMQARYEARRAGDMQALFAVSSLRESTLRNDLGDLEYEQYLEAQGRPTTVRIGAVITSSPGQLAGLQSGDEIVRYDGQRVFNYFDLNSQQMQGNAGESVVVDIMRDGSSMQVVIPRGPIGIQNRSRRRLN